MAREFPTRQVLAKHLEQRTPLRSLIMRAARIVSMRAASSETISPAVSAASPPSPVFAMVLGLDTVPRQMSIAEVAEFRDPFTSQLLLKNTVPLTLEELSAAINGLPEEEARPLRKVYVVAEGAPFQATTPRLEMNTRLVVTWQKNTETAPDLLLSTVTALEDSQSLMQLIAWSEVQGVYHFFERKKGIWAWAGNSRHALAGETRGMGPFDSHINGGLVMKELKFPWVHWHSQANSIPRELIFSSEKERVHPLFAQLEGAEALEAAVIAGVRRWTKRRLANDLSQGLIKNFHQYARQITWTTSVNLAASGTLTPQLSNVSEVSLPRTFFFDEDGLRDAIELMTGADILPPHEITVDAGLYATSLRDLMVHVEDGLPGHSIAVDTVFAFAVPERAFEDRVVIQELMSREVLSPRLALCLLMVDFSNPIFSPERAALLPFFPDSIESGQNGVALDKSVIASATAAAAGSAAAKQLVEFWNDTNLLASVEARLSEFATALQTRLRTHDGVVDLLRLADSRKQAFRRRKLHEFPHTTSITGAPVAHLAMRPDATVFIKDITTGEEAK